MTIAHTFMRAACVVSLAIAAGGCAASAQFYSKTGQEYDRVAERAVIIDGNEVQAIQAAGGYAIGTISGKGLVVDASNDDVVAKAAQVAAKKGGTHVLQTDAAIDTFTTENPAQLQKTCSHANGEVQCTTTYSPPSTSSWQRPTGRFVVFYVPPRNWGSLPPGLRPAAD